VNIDQAGFGLPNGERLLNAGPLKCANFCLQTSNCIGFEIRHSNQNCELYLNGSSFLPLKSYDLYTSPRYTFYELGVFLLVIGLYWKYSIIFIYIKIFGFFILIF
jgi:hypothetical protein